MHECRASSCVNPLMPTDLCPLPHNPCGLWNRAHSPAKQQFQAVSDECVPEAISILSVVPEFQNVNCKSSCWWRDVRGCGSTSSIWLELDGFLNWNKHRQTTTTNGNAGLNWEKSSFTLPLAGCELSTTQWCISACHWASRTIWTTETLLPDSINALSSSCFLL